MIHTMHVLYECPECGYNALSSLDTQFNMICQWCKKSKKNDEDFFVYMDPIKVIQTIETDFYTEEETVFIPSKPMFVDGKYSSEHIAHCDECKKCDSCKHKEDFSCSNNKDGCVTTCSKCNSASFNKLDFIQKHGFSYDELWNLDATIASFIIPRLREFMKDMNSYPSEFSEYEDGMKIWKKRLRMILCFLRMLKKGNLPWVSKEEEESLKTFASIRYLVYKTGKEFFGKYIDTLWD